MYSTRERLKHRTPKGGIDRPAYLQHLVDEYYETSDLEAQQQVTANLANFAYDPINWEYLKAAKAHELFYSILEESGSLIADRKLLLHAIAGLCNFSLEPIVAEFLERCNGLGRIVDLIEKRQKDSEFLWHALTCLTFTVDKHRAKLIGIERLTELMRELKCSTDTQVQNLATVLLEDLSVSDASNDAGSTSALTEDLNPIHQSIQRTEEDKAKSIFVNGALLNAVTAGMIGSNFPGYVVTGQSFRFPNRCRLHQAAEFTVRIEELRKVVTVSYECKQNQTIVFEGTAKLFAVRKSTP